MKDEACVHILKSWLTPFTFIQSSRNTHTSEAFVTLNALLICTIQNTWLHWNLFNLFCFWVLSLSAHRRAVHKRLDISIQQSWTNIKCFQVLTPVHFSLMFVSVFPLHLRLFSHSFSLNTLKCVTLFNRIVQKIGSSSFAFLNGLGKMIQRRNYIFVELSGVSSHFY